MYLKWIFLGEEHCKVTIQEIGQSPTTMFLSRVPVFGLDEFTYIYIHI